MKPTRSHTETSPIAYLGSIIIKLTGLITNRSALPLSILLLSCSISFAASGDPGWISWARPIMSWQPPNFTYNFQPFVSSPALAEDGTIYLATQGGIAGTPQQNVHVTVAFRPGGWNGGYCFGRAEQIWNQERPDNSPSSPSIGADGTVFVGANAPSVYSYSPGLLDRNWTAYTPGDTASPPWQWYSDVCSTPAIAPDGTLYLGIDDSYDVPSYVYALYQSGGGFAWDNPLNTAGELGNGDTDSSLAIANDGTVYNLGEHNGLLTAFNTVGRNCVVKWQSLVPSDIAPLGLPVHFNASPAIDTDGTVYVGGEIGVTAFCPTTGAPLWNFVPHARPTLRCFQSSPILGYNNTLFIGGEDGLLYALDTSPTSCNNRLKWTWCPPDWIGHQLHPIISTAALSENNMLYVTMQGPDDDQTAWLFALDAANNPPTEDWRVNLKIPFGNPAQYWGVYTSSSPLIAPNGTIYVADSTNIFAITDHAGQLYQPANTAWPMYQHDARRTGCKSSFQNGICSHVDQTSLAAYWNLDTDATDVVGGHNGTLQGSYSFIMGEVQGAVDFSGSPSAHAGFSVPDSPALNFGPGQDFAITAWIAPVPANTAYGVEEIVSKRIVNGGSTEGYEFCLVNGQVVFQMSDTLSPPLSAGWTGPQLFDNSWHHVAVCVNHSASPSGAIYVDGQLVTTFYTDSEPGDLTTTAPLLVALHPDPTLYGDYSGGIDELRLWRRALSPSEIYSFYIHGSHGNCDL